MSAFGSSAINKSNKKIAPKVQIQRRRPTAVAGTTASEQSAARTSAERRDSLQTPAPAGTRPTQYNSPASILGRAAPNHAESRPPSSHLFPRPSTAGEIQPATTSNGVPIIFVSGKGVTKELTSRLDDSSSGAQETPAQESVYTVRGVQDITAVRAKTTPITRSPSRLAAARDSLSAIMEDTTTLEPASSPGEERLYQPPSKRRKFDRVQNPKDTSLTAGLSENNSTLIPTVERDMGPEIPADEQPLTRKSIHGRAAVVKSRRKTAATVGKPQIGAKRADKAPAQKRKGRARAKDSIGAGATSDGGRASPRRKSRSESRQKRARGKTPEDAENIEITSSLVKMSDLCKDTRTGKRSERSKEIEKMDGAETTRKQRERREVRENGRPPPPETVDQRLERLGREREAAEQGQISAPRMRLVNGKLVLDETSLQVDRHANAAAYAEPMEQVEESTLTRPVNAGTWSKREKTEPWDEESTERFYKGLRMFGTDFGMISKMFPGRSRRQIKLKFNKEERTDPKRVTEALTGPRQSMDIVEFSEITMTEYQDPEAFARELEEEAAAHVAEQKRQQEALQETIRQTQATTTDAIADGAGGNSSAKENQAQSGLGAGKRGKRAADKRRKNLHSINGGGEEVEIVGTIDG
ncbi:hypothetical protein FGG08_005444 [Glutinoglossum americanum]|uniref:Myb-like domain-containing protein n=1 Tax=Glutinoglossum americanum TaxID=1670608 RepID=A0A9P8HUG7_9PEZI|nr:hypothetical protein FGG08_005444 [Glutinoglossum americanum]